LGFSPEVRCFGCEQPTSGAKAHSALAAVARV